MAALIQSLYFSGSRLSTGEPNDSGFVYAYVIGTLTPATLYADEDATIAITQPITLDAGGRVPYATYPDGVWITAPVRLVVQDVDGTTVSDAPFWPADARDTALENDGFTGATVQAALSALYSSVGGTDAKYLESGGATARTIKAKFQEIHISVKDFGAVGDGVNIDTVPIQTAIARLATLGGGTLYFPPGTYKIDQELFLGSSGASVEGVSFVGAGSDATTLTQSAADTNVITVYGSQFRIGGFTLDATSASTAAALNLASVSRGLVFDIVTDGTLRTGLFLDGSEDVTVRSCRWVGRDGSTSSVGVNVAQGGGIVIDACFINGGSTGLGILFNCYSSAAEGFTVTGCTFAGSGSGGIAFGDNPIDNTFLGTGFSIVGNGTLGDLTVPIAVVASGPFGQLNLATLPGDLHQAGNHLDGSTENVTSGGTALPKIEKGYYCRFVGTTTGVAYAVSAPTWIPQVHGKEITLVFVNGAGGAVTGWTLNAIYEVTGIIPTTDAHSIVVKFTYDPVNSRWREVCRADTTTT